ncbi:MAG: hypothetical protein WCS77_04905 [Elusimicrobiaceae bacterium]
MEQHTPVNKYIRMVSQMSVEKASAVLGKLLKNDAKIELENVYMSDMSAITSKMNASGERIIGAMIDLTGDTDFKFLLFVNDKDSFLLTDLMLRKPIGTTTAFGPYVYSTVKEIGNILASAIAGVFSVDFKLNLKPTPPYGMHDFSGSIFEEYIMNSQIIAEEIVIIESVFNVVGHGLRCSMYIIPVDEKKVLEHLAAI